jgi:ribosomal protein S18 acetylase RimI-like enzyme
MGSKSKYYPIQYEGLVFGSVATLRLSFMLTEVKHLVVHNSFRKIGLGKALLDSALTFVDTPIVYATIRSKNVASLKLFEGAGFRITSTAKMEDHETHFLIKENEAHLKASDSVTKPALKRPYSSFPLGKA